MSCKKYLTERNHPSQSTRLVACWNCSTRRRSRFKDKRFGRKRIFSVCFFSQWQCILACYRMSWAKKNAMKTPSMMKINRKEHISIYANHNANSGLRTQAFFLYIFFYFLNLYELLSRRVLMLMSIFHVYFLICCSDDETHSPLRCTHFISLIERMLQTQHHRNDKLLSCELTQR